MAGPVCSIKGFCPIRVLVFVGTIALFATGAAMNTGATDARSGQRLAQDHCASCHSIAPHMRSEVAAAPPFDVIGRKYGFDAARIATALGGPHPRMNFSPRPPQAADIAAYIASLGR